MNNGKICVSVCAETADEMIEQIKRAEELADVIEIRFDCLKESEFELILEKISDLKCGKPFLATFRPKDKMAEFSVGRVDSKVNIENSDNRKSLRNLRILNWDKILSLRNIEFVDIDEDLFFGILMKEFYDKKISDLLEECCQKIIKYKTIVSLHDFIKIPDKLEDTYSEIGYADNSAVTVDVVKIAVQADDITDSLAVWKLLERAKSDNKQIIPIAMGEAGKWTRILGLAHGAFMTYASLDTGRETAPGQISVADLIEVYRVKELDEQTEIYGIVGGNTSYSLSPYMHNAAFKFHDLNAVYVPFEVKNLNDFVNIFLKDSGLNIKGFSVTNPHKQAIIEHLDFVDETAEAIGAVNTVKIVDGKLYGYNTDADGFVEPLKNAYGDLKDAKVAVLGAGGAARACVYALMREDADVTIFARNIGKAEQCKVQNAKCKVFGGDYSEFDIVINTTPLGTKGELENETIAVAEQIKDVNLVYDLVYNPFQTRLMTEADRVHVPKIGGMAMLVAQGMKQFEIWTEKSAPMKEMSAAALRKLQ